MKFDQEGDFLEISKEKYHNPFEPGLSLNAQMILEENKTA